MIRPPKNNPLINRSGGWINRSIRSITDKLSLLKLEFVSRDGADREESAVLLDLFLR